jgi:hypothetical protein
MKNTQPIATIGDHGRCSKVGIESSHTEHPLIPGESIGPSVPHGCDSPTSHAQMARVRIPEDKARADPPPVMPVTEAGLLIGSRPLADDLRHNGQQIYLIDGAGSVFGGVKELGACSSRVPT